MAMLFASSIAFGQSQYKVLWSFAGSPADGQRPLGALISDRGGRLFGTTQLGGDVQNSACAQGCGTVFVLRPNKDGSWSEFILYSFCQDYNSDNGQCLDGEYPEAGLVIDEKGNLYGTTYGGGPGCPVASYGCGTVFELSPPLKPSGKWVETVLYSFCPNYVHGRCPDGNSPSSQLILDTSGNLYGTTSLGGTGYIAGGTAFQMSLGNKGWIETVLYSFCSLGHQDEICPDGSLPKAGLTMDAEGDLYGATATGGSRDSTGEGTVYKLSAGSNGWLETVLLAAPYPFNLGGIPLGTISLDPSGAIYTSFEVGGLAEAGGVVRLLPTGAHSEFLFDGVDGHAPTAGVLLDSRGGALYGTTSGGGTGGNIFELTGVGQEIVLYSFCSQQHCTDGMGPMASLIADKSWNLYGTTEAGGANTNCDEGLGCGVVFEVSPESPREPIR